MRKLKWYLSVLTILAVFSANAQYGDFEINISTLPAAINLGSNAVYQIQVLNNGGTAYPAGKIKIIAPAPINGKILGFAPGASSSEWQIISITSTTNPGGGGNVATLTNTIPLNAYSESQPSLLIQSAAVGGISTFLASIGFNSTNPVADSLTYGNLLIGNDNSQSSLIVNSILNPDMNATFTNVSISGDMSNNDMLITGSSFGTPVISGSNPNTALPVMSADGNYTFVTSVPGTYNFSVPVCRPGQSICPNELLTITVNDAFNPANPPSANNDLAEVKTGGVVSVNVKGNDEPGNPGGSLGNPSVTTPPLNGTTFINPDGTIKYTPAPGFTGVDSFKYTICDTSLTPDLCDVATVFVKVKPLTAPNSVIANDDYVKTANKIPVSGNVLVNDIDPENNALTVTAQNVSIPGKGTLVLTSNGAYTFTPNPTFSGPVNFEYQVCDNGLPSACAKATLYIVVDPASALNSDFNVTDIGVPVTGNMGTNDMLLPDTKFGNPIAVAGNPTTVLPVINQDGTYSFATNIPGVYQFVVPVCPTGQTSNCATELLTITVNDPTLANTPPVVNPDMGSVKINQSVNINVRANDDATSLGGALGNPTISTQPLHGTATINPDGTIKYTPSIGFTGLDTLRYSVCDTSLVVDLCATTYVVVKVLPASATNTTMAADDYVNTYGTVPASGNVLNNDIDPEGNTQIVTPQNISNTNGTLTLASNGAYIFTASPAFQGGALDFEYQVCDNGNPQACAKATLHVLVDKAPDYTPLIFATSTLYSNNETIREYGVGIYNVNNTLNKGALKVRISQVLPNKEIIVVGNTSSINFNGLTFTVNNNLWDIALVGSTYEFTLKPNITIPASGALYIGLKVKVPEEAPNSQIQNLTATIVFGTGGDTVNQNNSYTIKLTKN